MRIAILGSVALPVPPPAQGGTEWIAYYQAKGLADLGHKVILFAACGSEKDGSYELVEVGGGDTVSGSSIPDFSDTPPHVRLNIHGSISSAFSLQSNTGRGRSSKSVSSDPYQILTNIESSRNLRKENVYLAQVMEELMRRKDDYDIILNNMRGEAVFLPVAKILGRPFVNVMHLPLFAELADLFRKYNTHIITISNAQRKDFPGLKYLATIGNCVDTDKFLFGSGGPPAGQVPSGNLAGGYLLMMGTVGRHKNQGAAIRVAKMLGMKLVLAGKIRDMDYYRQLQKDIDGESIKWVGELGFEEKLSLYQNAKALLFPVLWEEPFGLVMIEAMACGTPVVAYGNGAIPEVVVDGKTGFVIEDNSEEGMIEAIRRIDTIRREDCRKHVLENFTVEKMVKDYEKALQNIPIS